MRVVQPDAFCLSGRLIDLGDGVRLLHSPEAFRPRHQNGCLAGLDGAACGYSQSNCRHTFVVWHIGNDDEIIVAEAIPTANEFAPDRLTRRPAYGFNPVLRVLELGGPRFWGVGSLVHVDRHVLSPSLLCILQPTSTIGPIGYPRKLDAALFFAVVQRNSRARFAFNWVLPLMFLKLLALIFHIQRLPAIVPRHESSGFPTHSGRSLTP